ncbi:MAG: outer membrane protein assembly factor BamD [Bacteroidales bacterium]|nr:outer membrane protein assembly factor BamD [Bacteroidales bacterium]
MLKKSGYIGLSFLSSVIFIFSCSGYEKAMKSDDYNFKLEKAFEFYDKGEYLRSGNIFDQIAPVFRGTKKADSVNYFQAMSYFNQGNHEIAGHYFQLFTQTYGNSPFVEDAAFNEAYCYYLMSPRPELDQASTYQAIDAFRLFLIRYPKTKRLEECEKYINELREKLIEKSFLGAKTYFDLEDYKASLTALNSSLNDYPETKYREEILYMIIKSSYLLAANSIQSKQPERFQDSIDDYYSFIAEYPDSKYRKDADRMYENSSAYLKTRNIDVIKE